MVPGAVVGDGCQDGGLLQVLPVEGLDVECVVDRGLDVLGGVVDVGGGRRGTRR